MDKLSVRPITRWKAFHVNPEQFQNNWSTSCSTQQRYNYVIIITELSI